MNSLELAPRNIYILNLPHSSNENEILHFYSRFGSINHLCILATLDSRGRSVTPLSTLKYVQLSEKSIIFDRRRAFINFDLHAAALRAVRETDGIIVGPQQHRISTSFSDNQRNVPPPATSSSPLAGSTGFGSNHSRESSGDSTRGVAGVGLGGLGGMAMNGRSQLGEQWERSVKSPQSIPSLHVRI